MGAEDDFIAVFTVGVVVKLHVEDAAQVTVVDGSIETDVGKE